MKNMLYLVPTLCLVLFACGGDPTDPDSSEEAVAGTVQDQAYSGLLDATAGPSPSDLADTGSAAYQLQGGLQDCDLNGVTYPCTTISYGNHALQEYELWMPNTAHLSGDMPLVIYVHGGGYFQGDKTSAYTSAMPDFLQAGYAFATINYRLSGEFPYEKGVTGEHPAAMRDGATAVQDLRLRAKQFGYSADKIVMTGGSAGGGISLWVALHDDLKDPASKRPRDRQSTKVPCVALSDTQTTLNIAEVASLLGEDQFQLDEGLSGLYGLTPEQYNSDPDHYQTRFADSMYEASPISHLSADDDVKVLLTYALDYNQVNIHSPEFGDYLALGQPAALAAEYSRSSLQDFSITFVLKANQKPFRQRKNIFNFVVSNCF